MKKLNKAEIRTKHLTNLSVIFGLTYDMTKIVFKHLKAIEMNGHKLSLDYCNGDIESEAFEKEIVELKIKLHKLLPELVTKNMFFNSDPRGYFLKLEDEFVRQNNINIERDWGGYGIICPEGV